jgi:lipopolysaccharide biosynthesis regulator YciM
MQHLRSGALSSGHKCFKRARKLISAHVDVSLDLKATVTKNTALLYKRAGVFDRAAELFRSAADMEDGIMNAPRRSTSVSHFV